jgi:aminopeptidase C
VTKVFGTEAFLGLSKADRITYEDSRMTHAMVITAIHEEEVKAPFNL